ncbi:ATP-dependent Clp protease ATP-binding subunit clpC homolog, chloroplastic (Precursor), related [Neospora caninum Liverpool]|uniref:ATP-dependent Clp protease ATP-binding subunit clpC homolog, chloroplastic (Precursor), related n=1 Tax=Neospora caninum (strain Liverpool) TaxID=572307 RepID=F0VFF3_NEOCL|nr:ATP-dependent Clp protease ATP-binding subunit clpC homolog, chloroplastic (Precursor), related [Neospora caninum Liverpool]CBZ52447.1 ATP-dependent Clp protease ATP-binding subunit clpC homolog, chloroplastic (Precursor), related [Neospora caninum Liverpool]CEL66421.1 TPA: ATP-dependent Clp protease ATP-binding subunit clpC homolog, chloroplastic (Precursor), related [Neospora caninum Liverpool]|eukprot:XP_003882479.1 ATP-dependent Clp protease ATP-binding subunit clpC homolog, chloroplastic (Precursor), related [Neospora caninum Liverpool]
MTRTQQRSSAASSDAPCSGQAPEFRASQAATSFASSVASPLFPTSFSQSPHSFPQSSLSLRRRLSLAVLLLLLAALSLSSRLPPACGAKLPSDSGGGSGGDGFPPGDNGPDGTDGPSDNGSGGGPEDIMTPALLDRHKPTATRENFTDVASDLLDCVEQLAWMLQHPELSRVHLVACLLDMPGDDTVPRAMEKAGGNSSEFRKDIHNILIRMPQSVTPLSYGEARARPELKRVVVDAYHEAAARGHRFVGVHDLVSALARCDRFRVRLTNVGTDVPVFLKLVSSAFIPHTEAEEKKHQPRTGQQEWIKHFGVDLTELAKEGKIGTVTGRENEIEQITSVMSRMSKANCLLLGEPGVGKTAVVEGLAKRIIDGDVPDALLGVQVFSLDVGSLLSGSSMRGEFERRMKGILDYLFSTERSTILFIDEIHTLMGAGKADGPMDAANLLKPALARGALRVIGATTRAEYRKHIEKDMAFARRFVTIEMKEPDVAKTVVMLKGVRKNLEAHHKLVISDTALVAAATLSDRYIKNRQLPDKAIDLIDDACSIKKVKSLRRFARASAANDEKKDGDRAADSPGRADDAAAKKREDLESLEKEIAQKANSDDVLTDADVAEVVSLRTGIPVNKLTETDRQRLLGLPASLQAQVIGQEEAVEAVANAIIRSRAGLARRNAPIGTFLFLGSTGVGKTELAKALTVAIFHDEKNLIRLDMSEYSEPHTVARLVGSPPGYMSHDEGGQLTEAVRQRPHSVVLFDEIENAHPNVFAYLLQLLDEGRLTDMRGITVDFTNCVIIATSNIGAKHILAASERAGDETSGKVAIGHFDSEKQQLEHFADSNAGAQVADELRGDKRDSNSPEKALARRKPANWKTQARAAVLAEAARVFKPQVLNRMTVIIFDPLTPQDLKRIFRLQEKGLAELLLEQGVELVIEEDAAVFVVERAYSRHFGARRLKRFFDKNITGRLAPWILSGWLRGGMLLRIIASKTRKNSLEAHVCEVNSRGRCVKASRRARLLCTVKVPDPTKDADDPL